MKLKLPIVKLPSADPQPIKSTDDDSEWDIRFSFLFIMKNGSQTFVTCKYIANFITVDTHDTFKLGNPKFGILAMDTRPLSQIYWHMLKLLHYQSLGRNHNDRFISIYIFISYLH